MRKYLMVLILILIVGCSPAVPVTEDDATEPAAPAADTQDSQPTEKFFEVEARQWEFTPETITVNEGDTVKLSITSVDVTHGFAIPEFGVNERLEPGATVEVEFVADKKGTFSFFCNVACGRGHGGMRGTLVVE